MTRRELTPTDYLAMLRRRWILIVVLAAIGAPLGYGVSLLLPSRYKSQTLVLVEQPRVPSDLVRPVDTTDVGQRLATMQQQILSRTRLEPIIREFGLYSGEINEKSMDGLVAHLQSAIDVTPVQPMAMTGGNGLPGFTVSVTLNSAQTAQQVCTAVTSMFIEEDLKLRQQHSKDTTQFLSEQLAESKANLDAQDAKLAAFQSHYMGSLPDDEQTNLNLLTGLTSQLDTANQAIARAQQDKSFAETMLAQEIAAAQASQNGHDPATLEQQLSSLQSQLADLQARYTDDYPDVIKAKHDIAVLRKRISENNDQKAATTDNAPKTTIEPIGITQSRAQIRSYDQAIAQKMKEEDQIKEQIKLYQARVQSSPAVEQQYKELTRGYQTALDSYNELLKNRDASVMGAALEQKQEGEQFVILDPANLPTTPSFPKRPLFALGGLAGGLALGIALTLFLDMQDTSIHSERDVEFALRLPVLAMIPAIEPPTANGPTRPETKQPSSLQLEMGTRS